jgi:hypothetical protein
VYPVSERTCEYLEKVVLTADCAKIAKMMAGITISIEE